MSWCIFHSRATLKTENEPAEGGTEGKQFNKEPGLFIGSQDNPQETGFFEMIANGW